MNAGRPFRVLCIDGGGVRGLVPAVILLHMERYAGRPIYEMFDLVAGTSTGALLASMVVSRHRDTPGHVRDLWKAENMVKFYCNMAPQIFPTYESDSEPLQSSVSSCESCATDKERTQYERNQSNNHTKNRTKNFNVLRRPLKVTSGNRNSRVRIVRRLSDRKVLHIRSPPMRFNSGSLVISELRRRNRIILNRYSRRDKNNPPWSTLFEPFLSMFQSRLPKQPNMSHPQYKNIPNTRVKKKETFDSPPFSVEEPITLHTTACEETKLADRILYTEADVWVRRFTNLNASSLHSVKESLKSTTAVAPSAVAQSVTRLVDKVRSRSTRLIRPAYCSRRLEELLLEFCGDDTLLDLRKPLLVPAYNITKHRPALFSTGRCLSREIANGMYHSKRKTGHKVSKDLNGREKTNREEISEGTDKEMDHISVNYYLRDVLRATCAAPTFFAPHNINGDAYVDGCVYANNPALLALLEAQQPGRSMGSSMVVVSLGTGRHVQPILPKESASWGVLQWASPAVDIFVDSSSEMVHRQMTQLLGNVHQQKLSVQSQHSQKRVCSSNFCGSQYFRFQPPLPPERGPIDNAEGENMRALKTCAEKYLSSNKEEFDRMMQTLLALMKT